MQPLKAHYWHVKNRLQKSAYCKIFLKDTHTYMCTHSYLFMLYTPFYPSKFFLTIYPKKLMKAEIVMYVKVCAYINLHKCTQNSLEGYILRYYGCSGRDYGGLFYFLSFAFADFQVFLKGAYLALIMLIFLHVKIIIKVNNAHPQQLQPTEFHRISDHIAIFKSLKGSRLSHTLKTVADSP